MWPAALLALCAALVAAPVSEGKQRVVLLALDDGGAGAAVARAAGALLARELRERASVELVGGEAQPGGACDEACLVERGAAARARFVIHGSARTVDGLILVEVAAFDAKERRTVRSEALRLATVDELEGRAAALVDNLVASVVIAGAIEPKGARDEQGVSPLLVAGAGVGVAGGAVALICGGAAAWWYALIADTTPPPAGASYSDKRAAKHAGQAALGMAAVGALVALIGGGIVAYDVLVEKGAP